MFVQYTQEEINELITAGSKNKKNAPISQEEKLFHSIKHVRLFDEMEMTDILTIIDEVKINKYSVGDKLELGNDSKDRIFYVISGAIMMPLQDADSHVELAEGQIFGEAAAFTKTITHKILEVTGDNTIIFSFQINKAGMNQNNATAFVTFYERLMSYVASKLLWFELA